MLPIPLRVPTWAIFNRDLPASLPLMGQFDPQVQIGRSRPIWSIVPGIAGGKPLVQHVGSEVDVLKFTFHAMAENVLDQYPVAAWRRLCELASADATLGRPPVVLFVHGQVVTKGHITDLPEAPHAFWELTRTVREVGPVQVTITVLPGEDTVLSLLTGYVPNLGGVTYEQVAKDRYGDARYAASLADHNQGVKSGQMMEVPRRSNRAISRVVALSPLFKLADDTGVLS